MSIIVGLAALFVLGMIISAANSGGNGAGRRRKSHDSFSGFQPGGDYPSPPAEDFHHHAGFSDHGHHSHHDGGYQDSGSPDSSGSGDCGGSSHSSNSD